LTKTLFTRKWPILGALALLWLVFTATWASVFVAVPTGSSRSFETAKFAFLSISAFGVLFSTLLTSFNSVEATSNVNDKMAFDRTENAFDYIARWEAPALKDARDWTRRMASERNTLSPDDLCRRITGKPPGTPSPDQQSLQRSVITMFNFFEELELSINYARVEEPVLRRAFAETYHSIYSRFLPWIEQEISREQQALLKSLDKRWH